MASFNKIILIGNLVADPELKQTNTGVSYCSFSIAVSRRFSKQGEQAATDFFEITCWREKAEFVTESFSTYTITWSNNYWSRTITAYCVDTSGNKIGGDSNNGVLEITEATSISDLNKNIAGYEFVRAYLANGSTSEKEVTELRYSQYQWEYRSNSDDWETVSGTLYFEYKPVVVLEKIPTITVEADNNVTITVKHYLGSQQLYQTKVHNLTPGRWVLEDITVTGNYDVISIVDVTDPANPVNVTGDITVSTDKKYAVYYSPQTGTIESDFQMFDYQVNAGSDNNDGPISINHPSNYPDESGDDQRMSSGKVDQSGQPYKYNTNIAKGNINAFTGGRTPREGIITGVNYLTGELELPSNTSGEQIYEPGFFVNDPSIMGHDVLDGYTLKFNQVGDTYTLDSVWKGDVKQDDAGDEFYPLDSRREEGEYTENSDNDHNHFFGMRYDIEFTIGEYVGDLNYTFSGDDDVWVVLDAANGGGQVVIDIGGIHQSATKTVDLWEVLFRGRDRASLTEEEKSETHTLTILYMERGAGDSNCSMNFTLPNSRIVDPVINNVNFKLNLKKTIV